VALECLVEWVSAGTSRYVLGCIKGSSREDSVAFQGWTGHLLIVGSRKVVPEYPLDSTSEAM
jgi:hypothetical protein